MINPLITALLFGAIGGIFAFWFNDLQVRRIKPTSRKLTKNQESHRIQMIFLHAVPGCLAAFLMTLWYTTDGSSLLKIEHELAMQLLSGFSSVPLLIGLREAFVKISTPSSKISETEEP